MPLTRPPATPVSDTILSKKRWLQLTVYPPFFRLEYFAPSSPIHSTRRDTPSTPYPALPLLPNPSHHGRPAPGNAHTGKPFEHAPEHAHDRLDVKDERSIANVIADAERVEAKEKAAEERKAELQHDPTLAARSHGNEPSRGAKKDLELVQDEEEELRKKEEAKKQSAEAHAHKKHH